MFANLCSGQVMPRSLDADKHPCSLQNCSSGCGVEDTRLLYRHVLWPKTRYNPGLIPTPAGYLPVQTQAREGNLPVQFQTEGQAHLPEQTHSNSSHLLGKGKSLHKQPWEKLPSGNDVLPLQPKKQHGHSRKQVHKLTEPQGSKFEPVQSEPAGNASLHVQTLDQDRGPAGSEVRPIETQPAGDGNLLVQPLQVHLLPELQEILHLDHLQGRIHLQLNLHLVSKIQPWF